MNELVKVNYEGQHPTVFGRDLHETLSIQTPYDKWFPRMCEYGFVEGKDFTTFLSESTGGRPARNHKLTIGMAKEICMIQRTEIGKRCREYFLEVERRYNERVAPLTPEEILYEQARIMLDHSRRLSAVEDKVSQIEATLATHPEHSYTIAGYVSLRGVNVDVNRANMLGRKTSKLSREYGYEVSKTQDPRFGYVNVYHEDVLKTVFGTVRDK